MNAVIGALLPLIVTLALGFFAAWRHEFNPDQALVLNQARASQPTQDEIGMPDSPSE
jgi:hypothetical protein